MVSRELADLLVGPLRWLVEEVRGEWGVAHRAHLQTRKSHGMKGGWLQLYTSNESPLCVQALPGRRPPDTTKFRCFVGEGASRPVPPSFVRASWPKRGIRQSGTALTADELGAHRDALWNYIGTAALSNESFDIEGRLTAGIARSRGALTTQVAPFLALDTESKVGFSSVEERRAYGEALKAEGLGDHQELDVMGILPDGRLVLVEVKVHRRDVGLGARQVAAYQRRFRDVRAAGWLGPEHLVQWTSQKARCGLLPATVPPPASSPPVPAIALPDAAPDWLSAWRRALDPVRTQHPAELEGLRLYRLSPDGEVVDEATA